MAKAREVKTTIRVDAKDVDNATKKIKAAGSSNRTGGSRGVPNTSDGLNSMGLSERQSRELSREIERVKSAVSRYNEKNGITGQSAEKNIQSAVDAAIEKAKQNAKNIGRTIAEEMSRRAGPAIGKMVAGFVAHEGMSLMFKLARNPNGGNRTLDMVESGINGTIGGATSGAAIGGPIGAIIGGALGGLTSAISKWIDADKEAKRNTFERRYSDRMGYRNLEDKTADSAFSKLIANMSHEGKIDEMTYRRDSLEAERDALDRRLNRPGVDTTSVSYRQMNDERNNLQRRIMDLEGSIAEERMNIPLGRLVDTGSVTDSYAKKGLFAGAQVNVTDVNDKILNKLTEGVGYFKEIAGHMREPSGAGQQFKPSAPLPPGLSVNESFITR